MNLEHAKRMLKHLEAQQKETFMRLPKQQPQKPMETKLSDAIAHGEALIANTTCVTLPLRHKLAEAVNEWRQLREKLKKGQD